MHYDNTTKALVVYVPPDESSDNVPFKARKLFKGIYTFYSERSMYYYGFLILFLLVSVFTRCLYQQSTTVADDYIAEIESCFLNHGFGLDFVFKFSTPVLLYAFIAFLGGFTVFSLPITVVAALRTFYASSFLFFATVDRAFKLSFISCLFYIGAFAFMILYFVFFFTETRRFYCVVKSSDRPKKLSAVYFCMFLLFVFLYCGATYFNYNLLFDI